jgi:hypothetical protein
MPLIINDIAEVITIATDITQLMVLSYPPSRVVVSQVPIAVG